MQKLVRWATSADNGLLLKRCACVLGPQSSGKSRMFDRLKNDLDCLGTRTELVNFESTVEFLRMHGDSNVASVVGGTNSAKSRSLIVRFGLINCWAKQVSDLSSGELRKLMLANAISNEPHVLILEGPHDGLDPKSRKQLSQLLDSIVVGLGRILVDLGGVGPKLQKIKPKLLISSYRRDEIPASMDRVFLMNKSNIIDELELHEDPEANQKLFQDTFDSATSQRWLLNDVDSSQIEALFDRERLLKSRASNVVAMLRNTTIRYFKSNNDGKVTGIGGLSDVSLDIKEGTTTCFTGNNGAGKSLCCRLISTPDLLNTETRRGRNTTGNDSETVSLYHESNESDTVSMFGFLKGSNEAASAIKSMVSVVSPKSHMHTIDFVRDIEEAPRDFCGLSFGKVTAGHVIASGLLGGSCSGRESRAGLTHILRSPETFTVNKKKVISASKLVGLPEQMCLFSPFLDLSTGEQRFVLIARALINSPRLCIFDECSHGLSSFSRSHLNNLMKHLVNSVDTAIVVVTHHSDEVPESANRMVAFSDGIKKRDALSNAAEIRRFIEAEYSTQARS